MSGVITNAKLYGTEYDTYSFTSTPENPFLRVMRQQFTGI